MKYGFTQTASPDPHPSIEEIALRHSSRGMTILPQYLQRDYCRRAAERLLELPRDTILLTTGFYVAGAA